MFLAALATSSPYWPFAVLAICIATVILLISVLRVHAFIALILAAFLAGFLTQTPRPRMNEAALVAGIDPEIDYYLLLSQNKPTPWDRPPLQDRALQQAVDLIDTTRFLEPGAKGRR